MDIDPKPGGSKGPTPSPPTSILLPEEFVVKKDHVEPKAVRARELGILTIMFGLMWLSVAFAAISLGLHSICAQNLELKYEEDQSVYERLGSLMIQPLPYRFMETHEECLGRAITFADAHYLHTQSYQDYPEVLAPTVQWAEDECAKLFFKVNVWIPKTKTMLKKSLDRFWEGSMSGFVWTKNSAIKTVGWLARFLLRTNTVEPIEATRNVQTISENVAISNHTAKIPLSVPMPANFHLDCSSSVCRLLYSPPDGPFTDLATSKRTTGLPVGIEQARKDVDFYLYIFKLSQIRTFTTAFAWIFWLGGIAIGVIGVFIIPKGSVQCDSFTKEMSMSRRLVFAISILKRATSHFLDSTSTTVKAHVMANLLLVCGCGMLIVFFINSKWSPRDNFQSVLVAIKDLKAIFRWNFATKDCTTSTDSDSILSSSSTPCCCQPYQTNLFTATTPQEVFEKHLENIRNESDIREYFDEPSTYLSSDEEVEMEADYGSDWSIFDE